MRKSNIPSNVLRIFNIHEGILKPLKYTGSIVLIISLKILITIFLYYFQEDYFYNSNFIIVFKIICKFLIN